MQEISDEVAVARLREKIEEKLGRPIRSPKDFNFLAVEIFAEVHVNISATTLKRVWGYIEGGKMPRLSTLDVLAWFVGYDDWESFKQEVSDGGGKMPKGTPQTNLRRRLMVLTALVLVVLAVFGFYGYRQLGLAGGDEVVIKVGDRFATAPDYLKLFGINAKDSLWGQEVPHHPLLSIWGPKYHHPHWHNDGNKEKMMPTITEYWTSKDVDPEDVAQRNFDQYKHYKRLNEIRITFMKNLVDSGYVYLGVYRLSLEKSDTTKCVWEKVADDCDLNKLDYLETLRN